MLGKYSLFENCPIFRTAAACRMGEGGRRKYLAFEVTSHFSRTISHTFSHYVAFCVVTLIFPATDWYKQCDCAAGAREAGLTGREKDLFRHKYLLPYWGELKNSQPRNCFFVGTFCFSIFFSFFSLFNVCFSVRDQEQGGTKWLFSEPGMQNAAALSGTARNGRQGRWMCVQKRVLNKEAWSCKVLLGKLLTFLQVKCLKELQSQALRKRGHAPKNQHLGAQTGENTRWREERQCRGASVPILLHAMKDAERRAGIVVPKEQHLPAHHCLSLGIACL